VHDPFPTLRDHLFDPSGGLTYQLRALRYRRGLWAGFHATVAGWLSDWQPNARTLVIVGPNAGHALPPGFLERFEQVIALEPDPIARHLLARRPGCPPATLRQARLPEHPGWPGPAGGALSRRRLPFSNVLGQVAAPGGSWTALLTPSAATALGELSRCDLHHPGPDHRAPLRSTTSPSLEALLAHFWTRGEITVTDHETLHLGGRGPSAMPCGRSRRHAGKWWSGW
jgi:hypothetical protein